MGNSTPCKIVTPKNFNLKLCIRDYVGEDTRHANFGSNRYSGASPYIGEILPLCDFFFWDPDNRWKSKPEVQFKYGGLPFSKTGSSFISAVQWDISSKFGMQIVIHFLKEVPSLNLNLEVDFWLYGRHLVKSIWRHNPAIDRLIMTKFGRLKQNHMRRTKHRSISKSEGKFQHGGSPFFETGSSFISAVDWDISSKFGMQTHFRLYKQMQLLALNTEVAFGLHSRHLEKSILCYNSAGDRLIEKKIVLLMQNHMPMTTHRSKLKQEIEFQYGDHPFSQTGSSFISTVDWGISSKFGMHIDLHHF